MSQHRMDLHTLLNFSIDILQKSLRERGWMLENINVSIAHITNFNVINF